MRITRRSLMTYTALALPVMFLTGCAGTPTTASTVTLTQTIFNYLTAAVSGGEALLKVGGISIPTAIQTEINNALSTAETTIVSVESNIGSTINLSTAQQIFSALQTVLTDLQGVPGLSGNPVLSQIQIVVTAIGVAWSLITAVAPTTTQIDGALSALKTIPLPLRLQAAGLKH